MVAVIARASDGGSKVQRTHGVMSGHFHIPHGGTKFVEKNQNYNRFVLCTILVSLCMTLMESEPSLTESMGQVWLLSEAILSVVFLLDFVVHGSQKHNRLPEARSLLFIDLLSVLPITLQTACAGSKWLHAFKLVRLLKSSRHYKQTPILLQAMRTSTPALATTLYFLILTGLVCSGMIHCLEGTEDRFTSISDSMWFVTVTMSTVGYGDLYPLTIPGRFFVMIMILIGILFISMPLAIVGNNFVSSWDDKEKTHLVAKMKEAFPGQDIDHAFVVHAFNQMDGDGGGHITMQEFAHWLRNNGIILTRLDLIKLWESLDSDGGGEIGIEEFEMFMIKFAGVKGQVGKEDNKSAGTSLDAGGGADAVPSKAPSSLYESMIDDLVNAGATLTTLTEELQQLQEKAKAQHKLQVQTKHDRHLSPPPAVQSVPVQVQVLAGRSTHHGKGKMKSVAVEGKEVLKGDRPRLSGRKDKRQSLTNITSQSLPVTGPIPSSTLPPGPAYGVK